MASLPAYNANALRKVDVLEELAVIKNAGKIYLTYSASDTGVNYCMGMLSVNEDADMLDSHMWQKKDTLCCNRMTARVSMLPDIIPLQKIMQEIPF